MLQFAVTQIEKPPLKVVCTISQDFFIQETNDAFLEYLGSLLETDFLSVILEAERDDVRGTLQNVFSSRKEDTFECRMKGKREGEETIHRVHWTAFRCKETTVLVGKL